MTAPELSGQRRRPARMVVVAVLLLATALLCGLALAAIAADTLRTPLPVSLDEVTGDARVRFSIDRTRSLFPGDCLNVAWAVDGATSITVGDAPVPPSGARALCDGEGTGIAITLADGSVRGRAYYHWSLFDQPAALALLMAGLAALTGGLWLLGVGSWLTNARPAAQYAAIIAFAIVFTLALDAFTNSLNIYRYTWDWLHYIDMAEHGVWGNPGLVAPFAYRPLPSLIASLVMALTDRGVLAGFRLIALVSITAQLVLAFAFARLFITRHSRRFWGAFAVMLLAACATFSVKFYLFDVFRPDPLAFPLILLGMIALVSRVRRAEAGRATWPQDGVIIAVLLAGTFIREFCALPAILLVVALAQQAWRTRRIGPVVEAAIVAGLVGLSFALPRALIPVARSDQLLDVISLSGLLEMNRRNLNLAFGALLALLPVWLLITPARVRPLWRRLNGLRLMLAVYILIVLGLAFVGGTDISRFMAFLFVPMLAASAVLIDLGARAWEVVYTIIAWAAWNRVWSAVPAATLDDYLDFYVTYWNRATAVTGLRVAEAGVWLAGVWVIRLLIGVARRVARARSSDQIAASGQDNRL